MPYLEKFVINGGKRLCGEVEISGAKNAAVAIISATVLADGVCRLENIPNVRDVRILMQILDSMGAKVRNINNNTWEIDSSTINTTVVSNEMTRHLRASYYFLGALLGRYKQAKVGMPGGCNFGVRPIDQHIKGFEALGATVTTGNAMVEVKARELIGNSVSSIWFPSELPLM